MRINNYKSWQSKQQLLVKSIIALEKSKMLHFDSKTSKPLIYHSWKGKGSIININKKWYHSRENEGMVHDKNTMKSHYFTSNI